MSDVFYNNDNDKLARRIKAVYGLWQEWAISFGALTSTILISGFVSKLIVPFIVLILAVLMNAYAGQRRSRGLNMCSQVASYTASALIWTAIVMVACIFAGKFDLLGPLTNAAEFNPRIPYITVLIIFPVTALVTARALTGMDRTRHCQQCKLNFGNTAADRFVTALFHTQVKRQMRLLFWISVTLTVIDYTYYFLFYGNANVNGVDKYFFIMLPVLCYIATLFTEGDYCRQIVRQLQGGDAAGQSRFQVKAQLRFLVMRGDTLLITKTDADALNPFLTQIDTPATTEFVGQDQITDAEAERAFKKLSGDDDFTLRHLYDTGDPRNGTYTCHFAAILPDDKPLPEGWRLGDDWATMPEIDRLWQSGALSPALAAEFSRIYTVTMAWKTYDRKGRRRYAIKNYHPTFRLRDFPSWDVDYSDPTWLRVASLNQDRPFFGLRKFLRKFTHQSI